MLIDYREQQIYIEVVKNKSITKAANKLGLSKSSVSRSLSKLEAVWNVQLLSRSTRSIKMTEAGSEVYAHCLNILADADKTKRAVEACQDNLSGFIRITAPEAFNNLFLAPIIRDFLRQYPETEIDIVVSSDYELLIEGEYDLAFRMGALEDSMLKVRTICETHLGLFASHHYLQKAGFPETKEDLQKHNCLVYTGMPQHANWFSALGYNDATPISGAIRSNSEMFLIEMARMGEGILLFPEFLIKRFIESGELEQVMPDYFSPIKLSIVYPFNNQLPRKIRTFIDFVIDALSDQGL